MLENPKDARLLAVLKSTMNWAAEDGTMHKGNTISHWHGGHDRTSVCSRTHGT